RAGDKSPLDIAHFAHAADRRRRLPAASRSDPAQVLRLAPNRRVPGLVISFSRNSGPEEPMRSPSSDPVELLVQRILRRLHSVQVISTFLLPAKSGPRWSDPA